MTPRLTLKDATKQLSAVGITLRKQDGEYCVFPKGQNPNAACSYFSDDLQETLTTGLNLAARLTNAH